MMDEERLHLELTRAEALVLFEWLVRLDSAEAFPIEDQAEQNVLWSLDGQLEKAPTEPLASNYRELLEESRRKVLASSGS
jgi:hypothetical protein